MRQIIKPLYERLVFEKEQLEILRDLNDEEALERLEAMGVPKRRVILMLESYYGLPYVDLNSVDLDRQLIGSFNVDILKERKILPFEHEPSEKRYSFALADLSMAARGAVSRICRQKGYSVKFFIAFEHEIEKCLVEYDRFSEEVETVPLTEQIFEEGSITEWVENIIRKGIQNRASDIHIEPQDDGVLQIRYRIDGLLALKETFNYSREFIQGLVSRIKIISGMDIAEKRRPQDGRIDNFHHNGRDYFMRVSTVATIFGEKVVVRITEKGNFVSEFSELGFSAQDAAKVESLLKAPYGIIYLGGASGTGKTTTLYTMMQKLNSDEVNICSIEDPVEKTMKNINQIQVNPAAGITYSSTLRAFLRQDPDVIVVGEIRDKETMDLSIRASLTGHLVLTTIHANSALDVVSRILNMDIEPYLLSVSALGFVSQRLVRVLCPHCKEKAEPSVTEKIWIDHVRNLYGIVLDGGDIYKARGCSRCDNLGYRGRVAVVEIIVVNDAIKEIIASRQSAKALQDEALKQGFVPIEVGALMKAFDGVTSLAEAMRVTSAFKF